jgi:peptidoglycan-associated lipoprotein
MTRKLVLTLGLVLVAACGKKDEPVTTPTPTGGGPTSTPTQPPPTPTGNRDREIADSIARANAAREALVTELGNRIHFDYDQFAIRTQDQAILNRKAEIMRANPALRLRVVGHADDRGSDEYNLALGMRRATSAKDYLVRLGIEAGRIEVASLGEEVPLETGGTEQSWAMNRRGEFEIIAGNQTLRAP